MLLIVFFLITSSSSGLHVDRTVDIVVAVKEKLNSRSVYLLHDPELAFRGIRRFYLQGINTCAESGGDKVVQTGCAGQTQVLGDIKQIMNVSLLVATLSISLVLQHREVLQNLTRSIYVLPRAEEEAKRVMKELSANIHMSDFCWLLFLDTNTSLEQFFTDINIPFDCQFLVAQPQCDHVVVLTEVYRVSPTLPLQTYRFGNWTAGGGLTWPSQGLYSRRNNLMGLVLKIGAMEDVYSTITKRINKKPVRIQGYFGDIWHLLESQLNFRSDYYEEKFFGLRLDNASWNGMIGMIMRKEVHMSNAATLYNVPRMMAVDYLDVIVRKRLFVHIRRPDSRHLAWGSFLTPFTPGIWVVIALCIVVISALLMMVRKLWVGCRCRMERNESCLYILQVIQFSLGAFCLQGNKESATLVAVRIIHLTTYVTAVVIGVSYSASLISHIMTDSHTMPFVDFRGFVADGTYQLGLLANSGYIPFFKTSNDPIMMAVYSKAVAPYESSFAGSHREVIERVCSSSRYAFLSDSMLLASTAKGLKCSTQKVPKAYIDILLSLVMQKRSPYLRIFRHTLHDLFRNGMLRAISRRYVPVKTAGSSIVVSSVTVSQVTPILVVMAAGVIIATVLMVTENFYHSFYRKRRKKLLKFY